MKVENNKITLKNNALRATLIESSTNNYTAALSKNISKLKLFRHDKLVASRQLKPLQIHIFQSRSGQTPDIHRSTILILTVPNYIHQSIRFSYSLSMRSKWSSSTGLTPGSSLSLFSLRAVGALKARRSLENTSMTDSYFSGCRGSSSTCSITDLPASRDPLLQAVCIH